MASAGPRITPQTAGVLRVLLADPTAARYGRDIARETGLKTGTLHPILARMELAGWVDSFWEDPAEHEDEGRPRRRYYRLTGEGVQAARSALLAFASKTQGEIRSSAKMRPQPGY